MNEIAQAANLLILKDKLAIGKGVNLKVFGLELVKLSLENKRKICKIV